MKLLPNVYVESVLTAHPTEAKRSTVRECHRAIYEELSHSEHSKFAPRETARIQGRITTSLESLWRTGEIPVPRLIIGIDTILPISIHS